MTDGHSSTTGFSTTLTDVTVADAPAVVTERFKQGLQLGHHQRFVGAMRRHHADGLGPEAGRIVKSHTARLRVSVQTDAQVGGEPVVDRVRLRRARAPRRD